MSTETQIDEKSQVTVLKQKLIDGYIEKLIKDGELTVIRSDTAISGRLDKVVRILGDKFCLEDLIKRIDENSLFISQLINNVCEKTNNQYSGKTRFDREKRDLYKRFLETYNNGDPIYLLVGTSSIEIRKR